jgi:hypothetical protein
MIGELVSEVRRLSDVAFPRSYKKKYMWMLSAYMDETGRWEDPNCRFVGMAGLLTGADAWEFFEKQWAKALKQYGLTHFHMKDFAHSRREFEGWKYDEPKRRALLQDLFDIIRSVRALPFGTTIPMEPFRRHPIEHQTIIGNNPYYICFIACNVMLADLMTPALGSGMDEKITTVFAEQTEFEHIALRVAEGVRQHHAAGELLYSPVFRPMREFNPLQAADLIAYEAHKEADRRYYRPQDEPRWGWKELISISRLSVSGFTPFIFQTDKLVETHMRNAVKARAEAEIQVRQEMAEEYARKNSNEKT